MLLTQRVLAALTKQAPLENPFFAGNQKRKPTPLNPPCAVESHVRGYQTIPLTFSPKALETVFQRAPKYFKVTSGAFGDRKKAAKVCSSEREAPRCKPRLPNSNSFV